MQLVINSFGTSLRRNGNLFQIRINGKKVEVAAKKVQSILITTGIHFSSDVLLLAVENNIDVVLLDKYGDPVGRFWAGQIGSTALIRRKQLEYSNNMNGLEIVKRWTVVKLDNQKAFLKDLLHRRKGKEYLFNPVIKSIEETIKRLNNLKGSINDVRHNLMGYEGSVAALYWKILGQLPPEKFMFKKRSHRPADDPFNAMLNYAYGVLYSKVERACIIAGLDPHIGFLHTDNYNKNSLVFDMIEPFRIFADRVVLKLFTGRLCKPAMFRTETSKAVILEKKAKELLISNFNDYLDKRVKYQVKSSKIKKTRQIKRVDTIQAEAHSLANELMGWVNRDFSSITEVSKLIEE